MSFLKIKIQARKSWGLTLSPGNPDLQGADEVFQSFFLQLFFYMCLQVLFSNDHHKVGCHAGSDTIVKLNIRKEKLNLREENMIRQRLEWKTDWEKEDIMA